MGMQKVFQVLVPKEKKFFPLFESASDNTLKAAVLLNQFFLIEDTNKRHSIIVQVKELENIGDDISHNIFEELNKTFITPFDREDIHRLTCAMDNVMDLIDGTCQKVKLYKVKRFMPEFIEMSELILQAARELKVAIYELRNPKKPEKIKKSCVRINEIENQVDDIYHSAMTDLFSNETDAIELIKKKEILQNLERATDMAEDVADVLKSIIVKIS